jgi:signal transduction histidine kinase/ActR/RegA family two-component response regulator
MRKTFVARRKPAKLARREEEKRAAQLESLRQASLSLTASLDLSTVLNSILESALGLLRGGSSGHIFLYYPENGGRLDFGAALLADGRKGEAIALPRPEGLTYSVARSGDPILVYDMRDHPIYQGTPASWTGSILGLPLKIGRRVVGVMNVAHREKNAFTQADLTLLRLLGDQAAIAIENARLFEQAATERRHITLLYEISRELAPLQSTEDILSRAITIVCESLGGSAGTAFLYLPDENRLTLRGVYGYSEEEKASIEQRVNQYPGVGLGGWVAQHRETVRIPEIQADLRWLRSPGVGENLHAALAGPILHGDRLLGVLVLYHPEPGAFSNQQLDLLETICQQVGLALSNVERYQQVQHLLDLLAAEQHRLERLVEWLPVGMLVLDENRNLVLVNSLGSEILSILGPGVIGEPLAKLGPLSVDELIRRHEEPIPVEVTLPGPPRQTFEIQLRSLGMEGPQWIITLRDVTQERQNQARIQMQERLATVGQLAAGIAHDFNNIMAAILVYTDLLMRDADIKKPARERLDVIQQQVQRAASLIRQILDFSRRSVMEQSTLDLLPFVKELDKLLGRVLPETIRLDLIYQPGTYLVNADPARLQQVFMNLAVNARDAMPEGGILRFELGRLHLDLLDAPPVPYLPPGDWIHITIADTGKGIDPETLPHIFEPFFTTKPPGQGTGLGLAQAYGIIKQHEGYIEVHNRLGEGASFEIYLPALPVPQVPVFEPVEAPEKNGQGEVILVVEDDAVTREAFQALLEAQNYLVLTAGNGVEALELYKKHIDGIDLVISDIVMPEMGGIALYQQLRERFPNMKMLFVTGHPLQEESQTMLSEGGVSWLQKPFSVPDFSQAVQILLSEGSPSL